MTFLDIFFIGVGLAVDASCVSASNGLSYRPSVVKSMKIAGVYAMFQGMMPLIGYYAVGFLSLKLLEYNHLIALILLSALGIKMIYESLTEEKDEAEGAVAVGKILTYQVILIQGITTSIDALCVGVTMNQYNIVFVLYAVALIAIITMVMCFISIRVGMEIGTRLNNHAELIGGLILVLLGMKIFVVG